MSKKKKLVPELRFPEFKNKGEWEIIKLKQFGTFYRGLTYSAEDTASNGLLVLRSGNIQNDKLILNEDLVFVEKECPKNLQLLNGDIVICMSNGSKSLVGKNAEYKGNYEGDITVGAFCSILRPKNNFTKYLLQSDIYQDFIALSIGGGNINNLKNSNLEEFSCSAPKNPNEQQKIAACLSSLDDLIEAHTQKLDLLEDHKKGLMQNLFPQEGEKVPKLRFKEFKKDGEWEEKKLEGLAKRGSGHTPNKQIPSYYDGGIKWVSLADSNKLDNGYIFDTKIKISKEGIKNSSAVLHPAGTVILSRDAGVGKSAVMYSEMAVSQHFIAWVCDKTKLSNWYLYYVLQILKPVFESIAVGSTIKTIGLPYFKELLIPVPSIKEQQKVASCLSSLDELITAQAEKIEQLRQHKKGLMQGLFPTMND